MTRQDVRALLDDVFEEQALIIGGLVALHVVDDALVDRLFHGFAVVREKALRRVCDPGAGHARPRRLDRGPHPSIQRFLVRIGRAR